MGFMMQVLPTTMDGVKLVETVLAHDNRGDFMKVFHERTFVEHGLHVHFAESYYSTSKKGVIRGMHFQAPPEDHAKLVYVTYGSILDVVLDIRVGSPSYGVFERFEINDKNRRAVFIPSGFAHGFISLIDGSAVTYLQTTMLSSEHEGGILFDSFGCDWGVAEPIMSDRDKLFPTLSNLVSPFTYPVAA